MSEFNDAADIAKIVLAMSPAERRIYDTYTSKRPTIIKDWPSAHNVWFKVGVQSFQTHPWGCETPAEADWHRAMLAKAIAKLVEEVGVPTPR